MSNKQKHPERAFAPKNERRPRRVVDPETGDYLSFRWRTDLMDYEGPFSWESVTVREFCKIVVTFLHQLETMEWGAVLRAGHHHLQWSSLSREAIRRIETLRQQIEPFGDNAELMSLRVTGRQRIIGFRDRSKFYLLWWDPNHQVAPSYHH